MSDDRLRLYGTAEREPESRRLAAGDLAVTLQDGNLRTVRFRGHEVLRGIAFLVRDRDWGTFTVGVGGAVNVQIETRGDSGDTQLWLYDQAGRRLAFDDDSGKGRFARIRLASLAVGTYYVRIKEKGEDGTIAAYTLQARWTPR